MVGSVVAGPSPEVVGLVAVVLPGTITFGGGEPAEVKGVDEGVGGDGTGMEVEPALFHVVDPSCAILAAGSDVEEAPIAIEDGVPEEPAVAVAVDPVEDGIL